MKKTINYSLKLTYKLDLNNSISVQWDLDKDVEDVYSRLTNE